MTWRLDGSMTRGRKMRAVAVRRFGESALMTDLPAPCAEDSVLIRVSYAGVNPVDWQLVDQLTPNSPFPFVLGVGLRETRKKLAVTVAAAGTSLTGLFGV